MNRYKFLAIFILFAFSAFSKEEVQVIPVADAPQSETVFIGIVFPEKATVEKSNDVYMQIRLRGFPVKTQSVGPRADELTNSPIGQSIHVIVDNYPYFARVETSIDPFNEEGNYYESMFKFKIPYSLSQGKHVVRVFPARSYGESLKKENCFAATFFYVENKRDNYNLDISLPYITYNEPSGFLKYKEKYPVLLDFYVSNCELSSDGYKIKLTIDDTIERILTKWCPYYIYGLNKGFHKVKIALVDVNNTVIQGSLNEIERKISVE